MWHKVWNNHYKCHGWSSNGPSSIDLIFECTWCLLRMNGFWFNGKSIAQHEGSKGVLNPLLLPIFAITGVLPGHKWNTTQYRQNTMQYTSEIQLPLINAASLSQWAKSALAWGLEEEKTFCTQRSFCLPRTSSFSFQMSAGRTFICTENMFGA